MFYACVRVIHSFILLQSVSLRDLDLDTNFEH